MKEWLNNKWLVLTVFTILSLVWYLPTYECGATVDFLSWIAKYQNQGISGIHNCFNYPGLHHGFHLINYMVYSIFGLQLWAWTLLFCLVHAFNTFLLFGLSNRLYRLFCSKEDKSFGLAVSLLFLFSPYQIEVLTWNACLHYLLITVYFLLGYHWFLDYLETRRLKFWIGIICLHLLALFTLELSFVFPLIYLISLMVFQIISTKSKAINIKWSDYLKIVGATFGLLGIYLLLQKIYIGDWVGHYGAEHHLQMDITVIGGTLAKYLMKYLFLTHYYPYTWMQAIYNTLTENALWILIIGALAVGLPFLLVKKIQGKWWLIYLGIVIFLLAVLPVSNLYFYKDMINENSRYGYLGSTFLYMAMGGIIYFLKNQWRHLMFIIVFLIHLVFGKMMVNLAVESGNTYFSLIDNFNWKESEEVVLLNLPDNYSGMYMFRDFTDQGLAFRESVEMFSEGKVKAHIINPAQFNMMHLDDDFTVSVLDSVTLKVMIGQGGTWFWSRGKGAENINTSEYDFENHGWYYLLKMKSYNPNRAYLRQVGIEWEEVKIPKG